MRVCIVRKLEGVGGVEIRIGEWIRFIKTYDYDGEKIDVVMFVPEGKKEIILSLLDGTISSQVTIFPFKKVTGPIKRFFYFMRYFRKVNADVIIFTLGCITDFDFLEVIAACLCSKKVIISIHSFIRYFLYPFQIWNFFTSQYKVGSLKDLITRKLMGAFASIIYSCSYSLQNEVMTFFAYLPKNRFKVLYHGVDIEKFKPVDKFNKLKLREKLGLDKNKIVFISTSRLERIKNVDKIIQSFYRMKTENPDLEVILLIVGNGKLEMDLRDLVSRLKLDNDVVLVGLRYDVQYFLKAADIFVLASEGDAFGIALVEAMACGLFCIAVNRGGPSEILDTNCGYLIDSVQELPNAMKFAVNLLRNDPEKFEGICASARKRVEECFDKDRNIKEFVDHLIKR